MSEEKKEKEGEKKEAKKGGSKMILIIVGIVVVAIAAGAGAFFAMKGGDKKDDKETAKADGEHGDSTDSEKSKDGEHDSSSKEGEGGGGEHGEGKAGNALLALDSFIVNLQVKGSFLKTTLQLEFNKPELPAEIETDTAKIRDAIIRVLSTKSAQEILTPEGKEQLREEIKVSTNEAIKSDSIIGVYITEFIIQ